jgi:hypothetical protein
MSDLITVCPQCVYEDRNDMQPLAYSEQSAHASCLIHGQFSQVALVELFEQLREKSNVC